ncbi:MAG: S-layer homology domain-containing protein [Acidimicrobiales bacterium]|nr:S-layer homology domain-containing protein [Acidimicrobiales bacterium]
MKIRRKTKAVSVVVALLAGLLVFPSSPASGVAGFGDVGDSEFFTEAVQWMVDNDITTGTSPTCFSPADPVTRGQAAAFMWRMEGEPSAPDHSFTDIVDSWQQDPVSWMAHNNITTGTSPTTYSPGDTLTRGQLAALLYRLAGNPTGAPDHPFTDIVAGWQQDAVSWMAAATPVITTGTSPTEFSPDNTVTRGQLAAFFHRYKSEPAVTVDPTHPTSPVCDQQVTGPTTTTTSTTATTTIPPNPGDTKNCGDFSTYAEAKAWFDTYYPHYGDVAKLDGNGDLIPCESLPGAP